MAELAVLLTVYHGSAADSVFYRKKKSLWEDLLELDGQDTEGGKAPMGETEGKTPGRAVGVLAGGGCRCGRSRLGLAGPGMDFVWRQEM